MREKTLTDGDAVERCITDWAHSVAAHAAFDERVAPTGREQTVVPKIARNAPRVVDWNRNFAAEMGSRHGEVSLRLMLPLPSSAPAPDEPHLRVENDHRTPLLAVKGHSSVAVSTASVQKSGGVPAGRRLDRPLMGVRAARASEQIRQQGAE
jgi:hypothetical protein